MELVLLLLAGFLSLTEGQSEWMKYLSHDMLVTFIWFSLVNPLYISQAS